MTDQRVRAELRQRVYGTKDLGQLDVFGGGFINFGYWRDLPVDGEISLETRVASQRALYGLVLDELAVGGGDRVLEVGCGHGVGTRLALGRDAALVRGVDLAPEQVERARAGGDHDRLEFRQGDAAALPFADDAFDALLSVEAAQHFEDPRGFAAEAFRVLAPGGRLALAAFLAHGPDRTAELSGLLRTYADGLDLAHDVDAVAAHLADAGFERVAVRSIGEHVWPAFDRWLEQLGDREPWERNWIAANERGLLDYHLITANVPGEAGSQE
ncbi:class I SAM-dependent methyltransferase [Umezawaea beigongshangensis]|uniref:class I SAM-dependent methyltransferase n=1 Tax=Umezawaea beigongshangensis TaxID=2780383 RepID=UPI0018F19366|nr:class I SAM-dependent methyltransferase [Umezawaea beigongshangensis]